MKRVLIGFMLLCTSESFALGPTNICANEKDIIQFSKLYNWKQELFNNQLHIKIDVPNVIKQNYQLKIVFLVHASLGKEILRVPLNLQKSSNSSTTFFHVLASEANNTNVFASYTHNGVVIKDGKHCKFELKPNT